MGSHDVTTEFVIGSLGLVGVYRPKIGSGIVAPVKGRRDSQVWRHVRGHVKESPVVAGLGSPLVAG
jgi:hypothetical protein